MKVILNQDVKHLGEEGDVKDVATGYARNFLFPRNFALPCNEKTLAYFERPQSGYRDEESSQARRRSKPQGKTRGDRAYAHYARRYERKALWRGNQPDPR